jgi:uncharacterized protein (DUF1015 family)
MLQNGWLVPDPRDAFYLYRQRMGDHVQTGVVGAVRSPITSKGGSSGTSTRVPTKRTIERDTRTRSAPHAGPVFSDVSRDLLDRRDRRRVDEPASDRRFRRRRRDRSTLSG